MKPSHYWDIWKEGGVLHSALWPMKPERLELHDPEVYEAANRTKERRRHKLRSRNGKCLSCGKLVAECLCLATVAEYDSIEAGKVHVTRSRRNEADIRALDADYQLTMAAFDHFFLNRIAEADRRYAEDPDAYFGEF